MTVTKKIIPMMAFKVKSVLLGYAGQWDRPLSHENAEYLNPLAPNVGDMV